MQDDKYQLAGASGDKKMGNNDAEHSSEVLKQAEIDIDEDTNPTPIQIPAAGLNKGELAGLEGED